MTRMLSLLLGMALLSAAEPAPATPAVFDRPGFTVCRDVTYATVGAKPLLLDVYMPEKPTAGLPTVVWVHGGGWVSGNKDKCPVKDLVYQGYVVASINYRLATTAKFPAQIADCKGAIRFLRANARTYAVDPKRIGIVGSSAGGYLAAFAGTTGGVKAFEGDVGGNLDQSSQVQCAIDDCGPIDLLKTYPDAASKYIAGLLGGPPAERKELAIQANPVTHITPKTPPFLILHGTRDAMIPLEQGQLFCDALKAAGTTVVFTTNNRGHPAFEFKTVAAFFDAHLKTAK